ncbi:TPA: FtsK/SpoIIIE domain-containing protein [Streptococcus pneumoniae]|uniref:FtsK/SpoIIIE domain-containing protein n=1 Tax=Streptococcus pneumoniae TaxID=1313 RepID=UPI0007650594|nr:FtsK/SpoIIIE domain-containing protein [Streptococcus pneumoniae]MBW8111301.1 cell division protein FtsK [Streptococcus pneumoniae]CVO40999.1 DNA translocase FtsK [Streptococcus pneumoniae]CVV14900.1 DNA translocase FtsK [Streptococcus pneumoniae]CWC67438.1 DNA translocase FtsK [Streptococcus pneumoniae]CWK47896.1 DNA translocase FtsK [Streptococcus pneumoniae]
MNIFNHFSLWNKQRVRNLRPILYLPSRYGKKVSIYFYVIFAILTIGIIANFQTNLANTFVATIFLGITIVVFRFWRKRQKKYFNGIEYALNYMVVSNGFFESQVINGKEKIINYIPLQYQETEQEVRVACLKYGGKYDSKANQLGSLLSSSVSLELEEMIEYTNSVMYIFPKSAEKRLTWEDTLQTEKLTISENVGFQLGSPPHVLLAGSTKSGKTVMIKNLVAQYLTLGADIKLLDPKKGELSWVVGKKLEDRLGYKVVYNSPFQISGALREAVLEMNRRFQVMADNPDIYVSKGKVLSWADVKGNYPLVVVLDEGIAFKTEAETSKEGKQAYQEAMSNLGSLLVKSRQASIEVIVGLQRASSDFIPTYMRQNFGVALLLGATTADSDSCRMMFSSQDIDYKTCGIGEGYCQIDGLLPTPKFVETPFKSDELDFEAYFDEACDRYMRMRNERN